MTHFLNISFLTCGYVFPIVIYLYLVPVCLLAFSHVCIVNLALFKLVLIFFSVAFFQINSTVQHEILYRYSEVKAFHFIYQMILTSGNSSCLCRSPMSFYLLDLMTSFLIKLSHLILRLNHKIFFLHEFSDFSVFSQFFLIFIFSLSFLSYHLPSVLPPPLFNSLL